MLDYQHLIECKKKAKLRFRGEIMNVMSYRARSIRKTPHGRGVISSLWMTIAHTPHGKNTKTPDIFN